MSAKEMFAGAALAGSGYVAAKAEQTVQRLKWKYKKAQKSQVNKSKGGK
jgi:hypothetical protein